MKKTHLILSCFIIASVWSFFSCNENYDIEYTLQPEKEYQTMHSFGASDAWQIQFVGKNWPEHKKEQIAEWLFSNEFDDKGNPKGIGLSLWRFCIGAGSTEIGEKSRIDNTWKRMECFLSPDGKYDWNKQIGQQWFMRAAKQKGVPFLLAFSNAAPYFMTRNGSTYSPDSVSINLRDDQYVPLARFLTDVMEHFNDEELFIDYLSPLNEPQVNWWIPRQEGMFATNEECYHVLKALNDEFESRKLPNKIIFGEAGSFDYLYSDSTDRPNTDNQIEEFFSPTGKFSLRNFSSFLPIVAGHPYWSTWDTKHMVGMRDSLRNKLTDAAPGMELWSSEYCILEKNDLMPEGGHGRDLSMHAALYVNRIIHADIVLANATSWQWWLSVSSWDFKDGLIYLDRAINDDWKNPSPEAMDSLKYDGNFHASKLMWVLGNYSFFVRPGMKRIEVERKEKISPEEELETIMASAYKNTETNTSVVVFTNLLNIEKKIKINGMNRFKVYCTNEDNDLSYIETAKNYVVIPPRSVITLSESVE